MPSREGSRPKRGWDETLWRIETFEGSGLVRHLAVRDYLRAHPAEVVAYAVLKRRLVEQRPGDRLAYIEGKEPFMRELERRAIEWQEHGKR